MQNAATSRLFYTITTGKIDSILLADSGSYAVILLQPLHCSEM
jgi:hypothetical protein